MELKKTRNKIFGSGNYLLDEYRLKTRTLMKHIKKNKMHIEEDIINEIFNTLIPFSRDLERSKKKYNSVDFLCSV